MRPDVKGTDQTNQELLRLIDNRFDDLAEPVSRGVEEVLSRYDGKTLAEWAELGVAVFPVFPQRGEAMDDESHSLRLFTLAFDNQEGSARTWINTGNCMGVVRLRDKGGGRSVQIEIGSRFDEGRKPFFLTYLLSRVFGGSIVDLVSLGRESLWDMLLAFVFRRRLLAASAVGLFKQYRTFGHNDDRVRGRIDVDEHLRRNVPFCGRVMFHSG